MFNPSNDCFISSPSSSSQLGFSRQHHHTRYHPYNRVAPSYYPTNDSETYLLENNRNNNQSILPNYDPTIVQYDYNLSWTTPCSSIDNEINSERHTTIIQANVGGGGIPHCPKRRVSANKKERRRTQSINTAFTDLRTAIPNVQADTKLSKIKTLKLATKYIEFLMDILAKDDPSAMPSAFKAEIVKTRKDHKDFMKFDHPSSTRKIRGRTGWPQAVWQSELNKSENLHQQNSVNGTSLISPPFSSSLASNTSSGSTSNSPTILHNNSPSNSRTNKLRTYPKSYIKKQ